jgi:hypothetical protein
MKTTKLTEKQAAQIQVALDLHRGYRKNFGQSFQFQWFTYVAEQALKARKVLHAKGQLPEVAAELATPFIDAPGFWHVPTREWEQSVGISN